MRLFQLHLMESGLTIQNRNRTMTGVRFLLRVTMRRLDLAAEIFHMKEPVRVPQILSADEAKRLLLMAGKLQVRISMSVEAPPAQRFRYELMTAMHDEAKAILGKQGFMVRMMAPDFEGLLVRFAPVTADTATAEAAKPETFTADAEGRIRIPERRAWRKENPFVQLSAMPERIELGID